MQSLLIRWCEPDNNTLSHCICLWAYLQGGASPRVGTLGTWVVERVVDIDRRAHHERKKALVISHGKSFGEDDIEVLLANPIANPVEAHIWVSIHLPLCFSPINSTGINSGQQYFYFQGSSQINVIDTRNNIKDNQTKLGSCSWVVARHRLVVLSTPSTLKQYCSVVVRSDSSSFICPKKTTYQQSQISRSSIAISSALSMSWSLSII